MRPCLLIALAMGVAAEKAPHLMKATAKRTRSLKSDRARVTKHLKTLLKRAPEEHKEAILKELSTSTDDVTEIDSWFGSPLTLDWIVDLYFDSSLDTSYPVILDSGSSNLAMAISSCTNCDEASTTLDPTTDSDMCIEVEYGSGSWSGIEVESSYVALGSTIYTDVAYAGITDQDDFFEGGDSYVGILGMAYEGIAEDYSSSECSDDTSSTAATQAAAPAAGRQPAARLAGAPDAGAPAAGRSTDDGTTLASTPLMYELYSSGNIATNSFAVAMCGDDAVVSIGGLDSSMYTGDVSYITTQKTFSEYYGYYLAYATGVSVGGTSVTVEDINKYGGLVVDTGTTLHYLPTATVKAIETEIESAVSSVDTDFFSWDSCVDSSSLSDFPSITYTFSSGEDDDTSVDVVLTAKHYLLEYDDCYYWGFESSTLGIFGNIGMKGKTIVFDITNNQLGIADGVCSSSDDATSKPLPAGPVNKAFAQLAAAIASRSTSELGAGFAAVLAVVGTVVASAFVVIKKFAKRPESAETEALLPVL